MASEAYGRGEVELDEVDPSVPKSSQYEVVPGGTTYTAPTVARFLGWTTVDKPTKAFRRAFDAYHASLEAPGVQKEIEETLASSALASASHS